MRNRIKNTATAIAAAIPSGYGRLGSIAVKTTRTAAAASGIRLIGEDGAVRSARRRDVFARRRSRIARGVAVITISLAAWVGSLFGSGAFNGEARFGAERLAAQQGMAVQFGTPAVHGHPGAANTEWSDMVRQFVALDAVN